LSKLRLHRSQIRTAFGDREKHVLHLGSWRDRLHLRRGSLKGIHLVRHHALPAAEALVVLKGVNGKRGQSLDCSLRSAAAPSRLDTVDQRLRCDGAILEVGGKLLGTLLRLSQS
jgi:hypothetical protein